LAVAVVAERSIILERMAVILFLVLFRRQAAVAVAVILVQEEGAMEDQAVVEVAQKLHIAMVALEHQGKAIMAVAIHPVQIRIFAHPAAVAARA